MRIGHYALAFCVLAGLGCKSPPERRPDPTTKPPIAISSTLGPAASARPSRAEVVAFEKQLQQTKLRPPARRIHHARIAFTRGAFAQLGDDALRIFALPDLRVLLTEPVQGPRAVLALPDGSLLAVDAKRLLRWEPGWRQVKSLPRPVLLPDVELYADAARSDWLWVFEPGQERSASRLNGYLLSKVGEPVPTPEQTIEVGPPGGVLGQTREGVWLYATAERAARFAPAGERLPALELQPAPPRDWVLPSLRVDQALWLSEAGELWRSQVSPSFRRLTQTTRPGTVFSAGVGDEGRLTALVIVTGDGPRFELELLDARLEPSGRVVLPADAPTGSEDWVAVVTANQQVVVNPRAPQVAVGGPARATIFDASGKVIFSIPSR
jgi:hypothetical protein